MSCLSLLTPRCLSTGIIAGSLALSSARADVIDEWNTMLMQTLAGIGQDATPTGNSRSMAIVSVAMFEATNAVDKSFSSYLGSYQDNYGGMVSKEAAAAQAARDTIVNLYGSYNVTLGGQPSQNVTAYADALLQSHLDTYASAGHMRDNSIALGSTSASALLANRANDGYTAAYNYSPQAAGTPGAWQPGSTVGAWGANQGRFLQAQAGYMTPWAMTSGSQFRSAPPPALDSVEYANAFNEVKDLGKSTSTTRTADQTNIAKHWIDGPGTESPPGHWNYIAQSVSAGIAFDDKARLFALLNIANADAAIATWETKRYYDFWRPMQAIAQADIDGNPLTDQDMSWAALLPTPSFPAYTSGHAAFSQASADILEMYFGTDNMTFTSHSNNESLAVGERDRVFNSFEAAADEAGMSRIYGGIHFQFDNQAGQVIGSQVAANTFNTMLTPTSVTPVPEPSSALLVIGSALGLALRRRR